MFVQRIIKSTRSSPSPVAVWIVDSLIIIMPMIFSREEL